MSPKSVTTPEPSPSSPAVEPPPALHAADVSAQGAPARTPLARDLRTLPNVISLSRIALVYAGAFLFVVGHPLIGLAIGVLGGVTDYLDGYVARRTGQVTELGALLDRFGDLVLETTWLAIATYFHALHPGFFLAYLLREAAVLSARVYCGERGVELTSSFVGKLKTNFLGWTAFFVYLAMSGVVQVEWLQRVLLGIGTFGVSMGLVFSYVSAYGYLRTFAQVYNSHRAAR